MKDFLKRLLKIWKAIVRPIGVFNSYLLLTVLYLFIIPWFSLKRFLDPLGLRFRKTDSYWEPRREVELSLHRFHRPF